MILGRKPNTVPCKGSAGQYKGFNACQRVQITINRRRMITPTYVPSDSMQARFHHHWDNSAHLRIFVLLGTSSAVSDSDTTCVHRSSTTIFHTGLFQTLKYHTFANLVDRHTWFGHGVPWNSLLWSCVVDVSHLCTFVEHFEGAARCDRADDTAYLHRRIA